MRSRTPDTCWRGHSRGEGTGRCTICKRIELVDWIRRDRFGCTDCGQWFATERAFVMHRIGGRCRTRDEMLAAGLAHISGGSGGLWKIRWCKVKGCKSIAKVRLPTERWWGCSMEHAKRLQQEATNRYRRKRYANDPEYRARVLAVNRERREQNLERYRQRNREYHRQRRETDPEYRERLLQRAREHRERNRERRRERDRERYATDPEYRERMRQQNREYRERKRKAKG